MSNNFSAVIKRGHCSEHDEHENACRQCLWLRADRYRIERDTLRAEVERLKAELSMSRENQQASHARWVEVTAELAEFRGKHTGNDWVRIYDERKALRAERDAALALADATQTELNAERERHHATAGELNKAVAWLDRCAWARSVIDLDAGPLEVQLAEAAGRVERLTTHRATLHRVLSALLLVADDHFDCHQSAEARVALEDCQP